ncbi:uncharacterized protein BCR38DRAFT_214842 [Pseudomassariella vexata]|uniref:Uncharacterized protein n=1 Tax=Pseudomassariella vexata TaxID=1141098 RepID=A0A1Y2DYQ6_9PEZI|nr:uncharacterized protein BCR38DRAFT_214842 [Pseudomassariella vexata]ORY64438.1 hypothetical protein BCR38DRAFT_214842 [Pseudomassariella vexata]
MRMSSHWTSPALGGFDIGSYTTAVRRVTCQQHGEWVNFSVVGPSPSAIDRVGRRGPLQTPTVHQDQEGNSDVLPRLQSLSWVCGYTFPTLASWRGVSKRRFATALAPFNHDKPRVSFLIVPREEQSLFLVFGEQGPRLACRLHVRGIASRAGFYSRPLQPLSTRFNVGAPSISDTVEYNAGQTHLATSLQSPPAHGRTKVTTGV